MDRVDSSSLVQINLRVVEHHDRVEFDVADVATCLDPAVATSQNGVGLMEEVAAAAVVVAAAVAVVVDAVVVAAAVVAVSDAVVADDGGGAVVVAAVAADVIDGGVAAEMDDTCLYHQ